MKFKNIKEIQAHTFAGNAFSDRDAFEAIHQFVINGNNSVADRAEALRVMTDKGMGLGRDEETSDEDSLVAYFRSM